MGAIASRGPQVHLKVVLVSQLLLLSEFDQAVPHGVVGNSCDEDGEELELEVPEREALVELEVEVGLAHRVVQPHVRDVARLGLWNVREGG